MGKDKNPRDDHFFPWKPDLIASVPIELGVRVRGMQREVVVENVWGMVFVNHERYKLPNPLHNFTISLFSNVGNDHLR